MLEVYSRKKVYLLRCNDRQQELHDLYNLRQEYISKGLRTADQPLHHKQQWVYSKLYYVTKNSLEHQ